MGVDISLLPSYSDNITDFPFSRTILPIGQDYDLCKKVEDLQGKVGKVLEKPLACYMAQDEDGNNRYGDITHDSYGKPIGYILAGDLKKLHIDRSRSARQKAAFAYIKSLPDNLPIFILYH